LAAAATDPASESSREPAIASFRLPGRVAYALGGKKLVEELLFLLRGKTE
jgi:hypothetical protein